MKENLPSIIVIWFVFGAFCVFLGVLISWFMKLFRSRSLHLPFYMRVVVLLMQGAILNLCLLPFIVIQGKTLTGFAFMTVNAGLSLAIFSLVVLFTIICLMLGTFKSLWMASVLHLLNCAFFFLVVLQVIGIGELKPSVILILFLMVFGNIFAAAMAWSTPLPTRSRLGKVLHFVLGQTRYVNSMKKVAHSLKAIYSESAMRAYPHMAHGMYKNSSFRIFDEFHIDQFGRLLTRFYIELQTNNKLPVFYIYSIKNGWTYVHEKGFQYTVVFEDKLDLPKKEDSDIGVKEMEKLVRSLEKHRALIGKGWVGHVNGCLFFSQYLSYMSDVPEKRVINILELLKEIEKLL